MKDTFFRTRLFGALVQEFPLASIAYFPPMNFMVRHEIKGEHLSIPIKVDLLEVSLSKHPEAMIEAYVLATKKACDQAISNRPDLASVSKPQASDAAPKP